MVKIQCFPSSSGSSANRRSDQRRTVAVEEEHHSQRSLLRMSVWKDLSLRAAELSPERFVTLLGGLDHLAAQALQVVLHPAERCLCGTGKGRIDLRHHRHDPLHRLPRGSLGIAQRLFNRSRQLRLEQPVERRLVLRLKLFDRQIVLRQEPRRRRVDQRCRRARVHDRHRHAEVLVDAAKLAEIRQLARARHVADRGEQRILNDRAQ